MSQTIKSMVEDSENPVKEDTPIKLNNISSEALTKIIEYIKYYDKLPPFPTDEQSKEKRKKCEIKGVLFLKSSINVLLYSVLTQNSSNMFLKASKLKSSSSQFRVRSKVCSKSG